MEVSQLQSIIIGLIISLALGIYAFRREALSKSGTLSAILVGVTLYAFGGPAWFAIISVFFISSFFFTRFKEAKKTDVVAEFAKGGARDFWQVLANGGYAAILALAYSYYGSAAVFYAFLGVIATVTADTWATELGILSRSKPRLITSGERVRVGTSGAISVFGTAVAFAGGLAIGLSAAFFLKLFPAAAQAGPEYSLLPLAAISAVSGLAGALFDSLLGATVQVMYYCTKCKKETEKTVHGCGSRTARIRGFEWMDNDMVNLVSSMAGSAVAVWMYLAWF